MNYRGTIGCGISGFLISIMMVSLCHAVINVPADYATIQEALDNAASGETVLVQPGVYRETLNLTLSKDYVLQGVDRATTIVDGERIRPTLYIATDKDVSVSGLTLTNSLAHGVNANILAEFNVFIISDCIIDSNLSYGIRIVGDSHYHTENSYIYDCEIIHNTQRGIYCYKTEGIIQGNYIAYNNGALYMEYFTELCIYDNVIEYNIADKAHDKDGVAVYAPYDALYGNDSADIRNNIIQFNQADGDGVILGYSITNEWYVMNNYIYRNSSRGTKGTIHIEFTATISNNTIVENTSTLGAGGINDAYNPGIYNNIIVNNSNYGYIGRASKVKNNNFYGNTPAEILHDGTEYNNMAAFNALSGTSKENNISCDPGFVAPGDCHISEFSCCIDAGTSEEAPADDIDGDTRPAGTGYDIGADEYVRVSVPITADTSFYVFIVLNILITVKRSTIIKEGHHGQDRADNRTFRYHFPFF